MSYTISKTRLLFDLYVAFEKAKRHKGKKSYIREFEENLYSNLLSLCDEIWERRYQAMPSTCFIINHPKKREIFAAAFRDRIVHHLYYEYTHELFERTFIQDTYSCIKKRGTHYGIHRLEKQIRQETDNYNRTAYVLKLDICGYFMSIDRSLLLSFTNNTLSNMRHHRISRSKETTWDDVIDFDLIFYLTKEIITLDPTVNCIIRSDKSEWDGLPKSKSLFTTNKGCGLPIGNLTSQLFSNIFLNVFDQYVKRTLKCKHYGRYVDDAFIVSQDKKFLKSIIPQIKEFLEDTLHLSLHMGKTRIYECSHGVEFLGAFIKPYRTYISNQCLKRMSTKVRQFNDISSLTSSPLSSVNSYLGILNHYSSFNIRKDIFIKTLPLYKFGYFNDNITKFIELS